MPYSPMGPLFAEQSARIQIQEQERKRDRNLFLGKQLSRRASMLLLFAVLVLIIVVAAVGYHSLVH